MNTTAESWKTIIEGCAERFITLASDHNAVSWDEEFPHIMTAFTNEKKMQGSTPSSIRTAIYNIASVGVSISPLRGLAHLEARSIKISGKDEKTARWRTDVSLSIGYKGQVKVLYDSGAVRFIRADVVRVGDDFGYNGPYEKPDIKVNNFFADSRKEIIGAYAVADLFNDLFFCEALRKEELQAMEEASSGYGPWKSAFRPEMCKKSALNRLCKNIPNANSRVEALAAAEAERFDFDQTDRSAEPAKAVKPEVEIISAEQYVSLLDSVEAHGATREKFESLMKRSYAMTNLDGFDYPAIPIDRLDDVKEMISAAAKAQAEASAK